MNRRFCQSNISRLGAVLTQVLAFATFGFSLTCAAGPAEDAFYHQLLKTETPDGYHPTRTFTIVTDAENGNQLVAEDDPSLRFNLLWMDQYQTGYKSRNGGAAIGELFRSYMKSAYKAYRDRHSQALSALPDENGSMKVRSFSRDVDYRLNWNGNDVRLKVEYSF
jgi:hypothetical protein